MKLPGRYKGTRRRREPPSKIPAEMVSPIREAKPAILEALRNRPATCSPDCYELEPGIWIHRPWTGCTTGEAEVAQPLRRVAVKCWHCQGDRECCCSACLLASRAERVCLVQRDRTSMAVGSVKATARQAPTSLDYIISIVTPRVAERPYRCGRWTSRRSRRLVTD